MLGGPGLVVMLTCAGYGTPNLNCSSSVTLLYAGNTYESDSRLEGSPINWTKLLHFAPSPRSRVPPQ